MKDFSDFEQLLKLEQDVLREIVREGERRLDSQLSTASAGDQRALGFLGFLIGGATAVVGGAVALATGDSPRLVLIALAFLFACSLIWPAYRAFSILRPSKFSFPGNLPENWFLDEWNFLLAEDRKLKHALVEECYCLNQAICKNQADIEKNAATMQKAMDFTLKAIMVFGVTLIFYSTCVALNLQPCFNKSAPPAPALLPSRR